MSSFYHLIFHLFLLLWYWKISNSGWRKYLIVILFHLIFISLIVPFRTEALSAGEALAACAGGFSAVAGAAASKVGYPALTSAPQRASRHIGGRSLLAAASAKCVSPSWKWRLSARRREEEDESEEGGRDRGREEGERCQAGRDSRKQMDGARIRRRRRRKENKTAAAARRRRRDQHGHNNNNIKKYEKKIGWKAEE